MRNKVLNIKELPEDKRDYKYDEHTLMAVSTPSSHSIKDTLRDVYHQGSIGTCYAFGFKQMLEQRRIQLDLDDMEMSAMFASYMTRLVEAKGDSNSPELTKDNGATLRDTASAMIKYGTVHEDFYPYKDTLAMFRDFPKGSELYVMQGIAQYNKLWKYTFLHSIEEIKDALLKGHVVGVGMKIHTSFYGLKKGDIYGKDSKKLGSYLGGHFVVIHSYDDNLGAFEAVNSWGKKWGDNGHFLIDYDFMSKQIPIFGAFVVWHKIDKFRAMLPKVIVKGINAIIKAIR